MPRIQSKVFPKIPFSLHLDQNVEGFKSAAGATGIIGSETHEIWLKADIWPGANSNHFHALQDATSGDRLLKFGGWHNGASTKAKCFIGDDQIPVDSSHYSYAIPDLDDGNWHQLIWQADKSPGPVRSSPPITGAPMVSSCFA